MRKVVSLFLFSVVLFTADASRVLKNMYFNVKDYGAKGDGVTLDTEAINNCISAAGGTVYFSAGNCLTGSIHLKNNIHIYYKGNGTKEVATVKVPEYKKNYLEPDKFKTIPAYGFFIRKIKNLEMHDVTISFLNNDYRPTFILREVNNAVFRSIEAQKVNSVPFFVLDNVIDFTIKNSRRVKDSQIKNVNNQSLL